MGPFQEKFSQIRKEKRTFPYAKPSFPDVPSFGTWIEISGSKLPT
jgi:hypothetical protein